MCSEQLQSFYELNSRCQQVIERLEGELKEAKEALERANRVIHQQHEMYYELYSSH
jgi:hypothetical protein